MIYLDSQGALQLVPVHGGAKRQIVGPVVRSFEVHAEGVYLLSEPADLAETSRVMFYRLASGAVHQAHVLAGQAADFTIARDGTISPRNVSRMLTSKVLVQIA